jgi:hypothetical protein
VRNFNLLFLFTFLLSANTFAGNVEGNGGNVFFCPTPGTYNESSVIFFDYAEGLNRGFTYSNIENKTSDEVLEIVMNRIRKYDKARYNRYIPLLAQFESQMKMMAGTLRKTNDAFEIFVPDNCSFEQLVVQKRPYFPEDKRYNISVKFWKPLPDFQKGLVKLHEVFYSSIVDAGAFDSSSVRYFLENIASDAAEKYSENDYLNLLNICDTYNTIVTDDNS